MTLDQLYLLVGGFLIYHLKGNLVLNSFFRKTVNYMKRLSTGDQNSKIQALRPLCQGVMYLHNSALKKPNFLRKTANFKLVSFWCP